MTSPSMRPGPTGWSERRCIWTRRPSASTPCVNVNPWANLCSVPFHLSYWDRLIWATAKLNGVPNVLGMDDPLRLAPTHRGSKGMVQYADRCLHEAFLTRHHHGTGGRSHECHHPTLRRRFLCLD